MATEKEIIGYFHEELGEDVIESANPRERRLFIKIKPSALRKAVETLQRGYETRFMTLSAVDHGLDIEFLYHFHVDGNVVTLRTTKSKEENAIDTIADLVPAANFIEREVSDLFGIKFHNHPQPQHLILTKDWPEDARPLRKPIESDLPPQASSISEMLISTCCAVPISSYIEKKREQAGLPRSPPLAYTRERSLQEFQEIMKRTEFDKKAGYDWKTKKLRYNRKEKT